MAQIFVDNLDDTIEDVIWAREMGLAGVAMPADHFRKLHQLSRPEYDRLWAVVQDLDLPMDGFWAAAHGRKNFAHILAADAMQALPRRPSEYFHSNYYIASFLGPFDTAVIDELGHERIMWGADFPHHEGSYPYSVEALRANFAGRPGPEIRAMTSTIAADVFGFDLNALQEVAERIGPDPALLAAPLPPEDFPPDSMNPAFGVAASPAAYAESAKR